MVAGESGATASGVAGSARRRARQVALQVLYAIDLATPRPRGEAAAAAEAPVAPDADAVFTEVAAHFEMPAAARAFARELAVSVRAEIATVDAAIVARSRNWRLSRMAAVDRNILRLATWELAFTDTPTAVVLNEAVDLARRFGSDSSPAFVNGILDAVARDHRETT